MHRGGLANSDWIQLNGPFNLHQIDSVTFRVADVPPGGQNPPPPRVPGDPLAAIEIRTGSQTGPIVTTANLVSTGSTSAGMVWSSQTFPISLAGQHELFLVIRSVPGGATGNNLFNLNWLEFGGNGVTVVKTTAPGDVGGSVPATLSLSLGAPASFGAFTPGVARTYDASTTANVISTAGDAALSVADPELERDRAPGQRRVLAAHAAGGQGGERRRYRRGVRPGRGPSTTVLTYAAPVANDAVTVSFQQAIGATDALAHG